MIDPDCVRTNMIVICSEGEPFARVDRLDGWWIKLHPDARGEVHYVPLRWVKTAGEALQIDRPAAQAMCQWSTKPCNDSIKTLPSCRDAITGRRAAWRRVGA
jgi:hypothetical protein